MGKDVVRSAREAFNSGVTKNIKWRLEQLKNFKKFLQDHEENLIQVMYDDMRKRREEAILEVQIALNHIEYLLDNLKKWVVPKKAQKRWIDVLDGLYIYSDPYGVVLVMGSWNVPLLTLVPVTGAIAAGNCVVIKPSHNSPAFGNFLSLVLSRYLDSVCYPICLGGIEETTKLLEKRFDYIYYTGSTQVGKIVHLSANKYLTPCTLELGGKNPAYIDSSADLELAANRIMWGKCFNSGQICIAPDYILCDSDLQDKFIEQVRITLQKFFDNDTSKVCPIINDVHFKRLQSLMDGLNIVIGGSTNSLENYIEPTVAVNVNPDHPIMSEEIFGPILPIITVNNFKEAVNFINDREKPLALYIFTENSTVRDYIIENTSSGGVTVNDTLMHLIVESLPFGGVGFSGMGRYKEKYSFDSFVHKKSVLIKRFNRVMEIVNQLRYPPMSKQKIDILFFLLKYRRGPSWMSVFYICCFLLILGVCILLFYYFGVGCGRSF